MNLESREFVPLPSSFKDGVFDEAIRAMYAPGEMLLPTWAMPAIQAVMVMLEGTTCDPAEALDMVVDRSTHLADGTDAGIIEVIGDLYVALTEES